jgi:hypothetical protein
VAGRVSERCSLALYGMKVAVKQLPSNSFFSAMNQISAEFGLVTYRQVTYGKIKDIVNT